MTTLPLSADAPWLAPLAGYSDLPFRMLCRSFGAAAACTEMVSVKGLVYGGGGTERLLATVEGDTPLVVQLFGADAEFYTPAMEKLLAAGFTHFDLNAGCPVRKVIKSGSGAALMRDPDRLLAIASAMVRLAGPGRVGVKMRLGFDLGDDAFIAIGRRLADAGVAWLTLHPRYGRQMFTGHAHWPRLAELVQAVPLPVLASGDLFCAEDAARCTAETGVAGVMFARGALHDPSIFARYLALLQGRPMPPADGPFLAGIIAEHIRLTRELDGSLKSFKKIRSLIPRYARGLDNVRTLRTRLLGCSTWEQLAVEADAIRHLPPARSTVFSPTTLVYS